VKTKTVPSSWLTRDDRRFDAGPYTSGALEAKIRLEELTAPKDKLGSLTHGYEGGIYHAGREGRTWVHSSEYGVPFLSSSAILTAGLTNLPLLSKKQAAANPAFLIQSGWTLITRSGTIGRMVYSRPDMDGMACSEHVMRVVPNPGRIPPGYLYAFLSCKFGVPIVTSGTYGAIIQHIEPQHIADVPVPRLGDHVEQRSHEFVTEAASLRAEAAFSLREAIGSVAKELGAPDIAHPGSFKSLGHAVSIGVIESSMRLEGQFNSVQALTIDAWAKDHSNKCNTLADLAEVYDVPQFKHIYVSAEHGVPFYTSGDLFKLERQPDKYLSRSLTRNLHKYVIHKGWILLARSGQLGGIIGRPYLADSSLEGVTTSDHVIRIVPKTETILPGYLFAYLSTSVGYILLTRTMTGASVPALWPVHLRSIPVIRAGRAFEEHIDQLVCRAFEDRVLASRLEEEARALVERAVEES